MEEVKLDDLLKEFEERAEHAVSSNRKYWEGTDADDIYNVDIHIWRKKGMGNSLQTIKGNPISIATATASYLQNLVDKGVFTTNELKEIFDMVLEQLGEKDEH